MLLSTARAGMIWSCFLNIGFHLNVILILAFFDSQEQRDIQCYS